MSADLQDFWDSSIGSSPVWNLKSLLLRAVGYSIALMKSMVVGLGDVSLFYDSRMLS